MRGSFCVVAAFALLGCNRPTPAPGAKAAGAPPLVKVAKPAQKSVKWTIEQPASVMPLEATPIVAKLPGYVKIIAPDTAAIKAGVKLPGNQPLLIDIGSRVEADQLLATVYIPELAAEVVEKQALVAKTKAELRLTEQEREVAGSQVVAAEELVKVAEAGIERAEADITLWKEQLEQLKAQVTSGFETKLTLSVVNKSLHAAEAAKTEARAKVKTATAGVKVEQARRARAQADVEAAGARVKVAEAELERVRVLETYTQVKAPFPGIITARNVHPGHFLQSAANGQGTVLFHLMRADVVRVFADIPEVNAEKAGVGAIATVRVPSLGGREYLATVTRTTGVVDPGTRTLRVEIDIENKDRALKPGVYATLRIDAEAGDAIVLPAGCVLHADETHYVYLVESGKAVKYRVQLGRSDPGTVQVLGRRRATATTGAWDQFSGNERVVDGNLGALTDGAEVRTE